MYQGYVGFTLQENLKEKNVSDLYNTFFRIIYIIKLVLLLYVLLLIQNSSKNNIFLTMLSLI